MCCGKDTFQASEQCLSGSHLIALVLSQKHPEGAKPKDRADSNEQTTV